MQWYEDDKIDILWETTLRNSRKIEDYSTTHPISEKNPHAQLQIIHYNLTKLYENTTHSFWGVAWTKKPLYVHNKETWNFKIGLKMIQNLQNVEKSQKPLPPLTLCRV